MLVFMYYQLYLLFASAGPHRGRRLIPNCLPVTALQGSPGTQSNCKVVCLWMRLYCKSQRDGTHLYILTEVPSDCAVKYAVDEKEVSRIKNNMSFYRRTPVRCERPLRQA